MRHRLGRGAGYFLRPLEMLLNFRLAEIKRPEKFLQADDLRSLSGGVTDSLFGGFHISRRVFCASHLDQADSYNFLVGIGDHNLIKLPNISGWNWIGSIGELFSYGNRFSFADLLDRGYPQKSLCYNSISYGNSKPLGIALSWYNGVKDKTFFNQKINDYVG